MCRLNAILFFNILTFSLDQHLKIDLLVWVMKGKSSQNGIEKVKDS